MTSGIGAVNVTVSVAWFSRAPRPFTGTQAHTIRSASPSMAAEKLCVAKLKSNSGLFTQ